MTDSHDSLDRSVIIENLLTKHHYYIDIQERIFTMKKGEQNLVAQFLIEKIEIHELEVEPFYTLISTACETRFGLVDDYWDLFKQIYDKFKISVNNVFYKLLKEFRHFLRKDNLYNDRWFSSSFEVNSDCLYDANPPNDIIESIMKDDIKALKNILGEFKDPFNIKFEKTELNAIEICCFCGSVECFKFYRSNGIKLTTKCLKLAIYGRNHFIINECLNIIEPDQKTMEECIKARNLQLIIYLHDIHGIEIPIYLISTYINFEAFLYLLLITDDIKTILCYSSCFGNGSLLVDIFECFGIDINTNTFPDGQTILHNAASKKYYKVMSKLISSGADLYSKNIQGNIPLIEAIHDYKIDTMHTLIKLGTDIDTQDDQGRTPLMHAARLHNVSIAEELIKLGAKLNARDKDGKTALFYAVMHYSPYMLYFFMQIEGIDIEIKDYNGMTPIFYCDDLIDHLIAYGANPKVIAKNGLTPVKNAIITGKNTALQTLFKYLPQRDEEGKTPLFYAIQLFPKRAKEIIKKRQMIDCCDNSGICPLTFACKLNKIGVIKELIKNGAYLESKDKDKLTPLFHTVIDENITALKILIENNADINTNDKFGVCPLSYSIRHNQIEIFQILIKNKANLESADNDLHTPLFHAIDVNNVEIVKMLIHCRANIEAVDKKRQTPLLFALSHDSDRSECAIELIKSGCKIKIKDRFGISPLSYAAKFNQFKIVKMLILKGCDIESKDNQGFTAARYAISGNSLKSLKLLIKSGCNINAKSKLAQCLLSYACEVSNFEIIKELVENGADIESKDANGLTPIFYSIQNNNAEVLSYLIEKGAKFEANDNNKQTPLIYASNCEEDCSSASIKLIQLGAKIDCKDKFGICPLSYACKHNRTDLVQFLVESGSDIEMKDKKQKTPIFHAIAGNSIESLKILINFGAKIESQDKNGITPLCYAAKFNKVECIKILIEAGSNIEYKDQSGFTPIFHAIECESIDALAKLIECDANIEAKDNSGATPLIYCAKFEKDRLTHAMKLIESGAYIESRDNFGVTALSHAAKNNKVDLLMKLVALGADKESKDQAGRTAIFHAVSGNNVESLSKLIKLGLNIESRDNLGQTPLIYASGSKANLSNAAAILIESGADINSVDNEGNTSLTYAKRISNQYIAFKLEHKQKSNENLNNANIAKTKAHTHRSLRSSELLMKSKSKLNKIMK